MAGMLYRFLGGVEVSPDTVALETIEKVGPRGNFLTEPHTLRYLRSEEHWQPTLCNRSIYENWRKRGAPTLAKKARERVEEILSSHQPAKLSQKVREELKRAIDNFEERKGS
jgi:trimethylamine--corrinoid protein Co-methyltransferase